MNEGFEIPQDSMNFPPNFIWCRRSTASNPRLKSLVILQSTILLFLAVSCDRPAAPPSPYLAFVVCQETDSVAVVNLAEFRVVASLKVSPRPEAAVVRPGGREIYVTGPSGFDRIELPTLKVYLNSRTDHHPRSMVFSSDGRFAYYLMEPDPVRPATPDAQFGPPMVGVSHISVFDCEAKRKIGQIGLRASLSRLALSADGKVLFATDPITGMVHFFDLVARKPLGAVQAGAGARQITVQPFGSKAYVSNGRAKTISVIDTQTRQLLAHIELGAQPDALLLKPDGGELFVLSPDASTLTILDAFHDNVLQTLPVGRSPAGGAFRKDSSVLYMANAGDGSVTALDVANRTVLSSTIVGREPRAMALTPDERFLAVADAGTASLAVLIAEPGRIDANRSALVTSLPVGARPVDVVIPEGQNSGIRSEE